MVVIWGEDHFPNWHTKPAQTLKRGILREWSKQTTLFLFLTKMEQTFGFPPVDGLYNYLRKLDYVKLGEDFIFILATIYAVVVGVVSYAYTAFQLYWNDNGESIVNSITTNTNRVVDFLFYNSTDQ